MITFANIKIAVLLQIFYRFMDIVSRLKKYMELRAIPSTQFADLASIPRPTLSQILSGRNKKISNELISKIHAAYPEININWLLFGDGEMLVDGVAPTQKPTAQKDAANDNPQIDNFGSLFSSVADNMPQAAATQETADTEAPAMQFAANIDTNKKIQNIIVFYTDSSFEIFSPSQK